MGLSDWLAIWGALLSSGLAAIKMHEWWSARHLIDISYMFSSSDVEGNTIYIRNLSNRQLILAHWEVFAAKREKKRYQDRMSLGRSEIDVGDRIVAPNSSFELNFSEEDYFSSSPKLLKGRSVFITLYFAGRDPKTYLVRP